MIKLKNEKGITLSTLVIYIVSILITLAILGTVTAYFRGSFKKMDDSTTNITEFDRFNMSFLEEVKKANNNIKDPVNSSTSIEFISGNKYEFRKEDKVIYLTTLNKTIKIAEGVKLCKFTSRIENEKTIISLEIVIGQEMRAQEYVMGQNEVYVAYERESDYTHIVKPGERVAKTTKNNYLDSDGKRATIPEGFIVSDKVGENEIDKGLVVIAPDESEFVWVPVPNPSEMYGTLSDGRKAGKLYTNWTTTESAPLNWIETAGILSITDNEGFREPDTVSTYDGNSSYLEIITQVLTGQTAKYADINVFKATMQEDFKEMIDSVEKYGGFYVGRYETSLDTTTGKVQSKKGETSATAETYRANTWYGLYVKQKAYRTSSVQGSMIWGCEYDAMLKWMQTNNINVSSSNSTIGVERNTTRITGTKEEDKLLNIYDILGNSYEWTLEANYNDGRAIRGGGWDESDSPCSRSYGMSYDSSNYLGSRLTLYVR